MYSLANVYKIVTLNSYRVGIGMAKYSSQCELLALSHDIQKAKLTQTEE